MTSQNFAQCRPRLQSAPDSGLKPETGREAAKLAKYDRFNGRSSPVFAVRPRSVRLLTPMVSLVSTMLVRCAARGPGPGPDQRALAPADQPTADGPRAASDERPLSTAMMVSSVMTALRGHTPAHPQQ